MWRKFAIWLRLITGTYGQDREESSEFNESMCPFFERLRVEFERLPENLTVAQPPASIATKATPPPSEASDAGSPGDSIADAMSTRNPLEYRRLYVATATLIQQKLEAPKFICTRSDLYAMESAIVQLCSDEAVLQAYPSIRERYRATAGADAYKAYVEGQRPDPKEKPPDHNHMREDALHLLSEMRRLGIALPRREQIRGALLMNLILINGTIAAMLILVLILHPWYHFPFAWLVAIWSLLGGMISVIRRLQSLPDEQITLAQWGRLPFLLSPVTSICFGLILLYLFSSGSLTGSVFPDMSRMLANPQLDSCAHLVSAGCSNSASNADIYRWLQTISFPQLTKLLIWSFIAGFAENFVPDTLDGLVKRTKTS